MPNPPFLVDLDVLPLFFRYRDVVFGHGFVATVETTGRALCEKEEDGAWTMSGVEPGGLSAAGHTTEEAHDAFRKTYTRVLFDIAAEAKTEEAFRDEVRRFVHETSLAVVEAWRGAVSRVRNAVGSGAGVASVDADTPVSVRIAYSTDLAPEQNFVDDPVHLIAA